MRAIGIDLGTTNSVAATGGAEVKVLPSRANEAATPSSVSYVRRRGKAEGEIVVGRAALNHMQRDPVNTILSVKRLMGYVYGEPRVDEMIPHFRFRVSPPPPESTDDQGVKVLLNDQPYSPTAISAMILKEVKAGAELSLGEMVTHAVITVPAYFEERQRHATLLAGREAGLEVLQIIDEPTAAAIAFGLGREQERHRVLVYDLGGGTFDISIIQMTSGQYSVLDISGDRWLGGDDFDDTIVHRMIAWVQAEYDYDPSGDVEFLIKAKMAAEKAKIALSAQNNTEIVIPIACKDPNSGATIDLEMELSRDEFESGIRAMVDRTIELVREALERQKLSPDREGDITEVLLVGGSTAVPLIQAELYELFGRNRVRRNINPMECVALGAAILAADARIEEDTATEPKEAPRARVGGVTALDFGIGALRGDDPDAFVRIIPKGTAYPLVTPRKQVFYPTEESQTLIRVPVYEGLNDTASLNAQQGVIEFPLPAGISSSTPVEVSFDYTANRLLTVSIAIIGTELRYTEEIKHGTRRVPPKRSTLADDWREELQSSLRPARQFLETYSGYLAEDDREDLESAVRDGEDALKQNNQALGQPAVLMLRNKIFGSGTASVLFLAERAMHGLSAERSQALAQAVAGLRAAHLQNNRADVERLSTQLRVVLGRIAAERDAAAGMSTKVQVEHGILELKESRAR
jgi:molecular chaperone DnaK (HSP70)